MTKKKETKQAVEEQPQVAVQEKEIPKKPQKPEWEIKDRVYYLSGESTPLTYIMKSGGMYWFDKEKGYEREIRATVNQRTPFVDEMKGDIRPQRIIFRDGMLMVPKEKVVLQKILSLYHPRLDATYYEYKPVAIATDEVIDIKHELRALNAADSLDIDMAEAVMRAIIGSSVSEMSSKELKRDLLVEAKRNPNLILDLINDDNIVLRNKGIKATEAGILKLSQDQRTFNLGSTDRKLFTVPFDEHPYSALAQWFKTDEGMEILKGIEKRLN
tara:strand:- start:6 stop:818 length:813 start_codon:yes stop_codon:yes gene_type:complete